MADRFLGLGSEGLALTVCAACGGPLTCSDHNATLDADHTRHRVVAFTRWLSANDLRLVPPNPARHRRGCPI